MPRKFYPTETDRKGLSEFAQRIETEDLAYYAQLPKDQVLSQVMFKDPYLHWITWTKRALYERSRGRHGWFKFFTPEEQQNAQHNFAEWTEMFDEPQSFLRNQEKIWVDRAKNYNNSDWHPHVPQARIDQSVDLMTHRGGYFVLINGAYLIPTVGDIIRYLKEDILKPVYRVLGKA